jgi:hypothetical protein
MLDLMNTAACLLLMVYSLPVAMVMGNHGLWPERLSMVAVQLGLFLQAANPWAQWVPQALWPAVYLNVAAAVMLTVWRRRGWLFVRSYLTPADADADLRRRRRSTDWPDPSPSPTLKGSR